MEEFMADFDATPEKRACLVLVADDDLTSRTILQKFLHKWGYQTVCEIGRASCRERVLRLV